MPRSSASCAISTIVTGIPADRKFIEMPPPIVPAPITPTLLDVARLGVLGDVLDLGRLALGEEEILLRARLGAAHQLHEQLALVDDALGIGLGDRRLDRLDVRLGRLEAAELAGIGLAEFVEDRRVGARFGELVVALRRFGQRADVAHFLGIGDRMLQQVALDDAVDQADVVGLLGADRRAAR